MALFAHCGGSSNTNSNGGSGGSLTGSGGTLGGSGGDVGTGGAPGSGGMMTESTGGAPGTGGATDMPDASDDTGEGTPMDAAPEAPTSAAMCAATPAMTDPALDAAAFCQELAATCKAHYMAAFNTAAKCMTAYAKVKNAVCSSYHLCLAAANPKVNLAANCNSAQGAAPCNK
ncbi:MAG TPA: hypothetical protein VMU50_09190 [Polyangia bacterium]|nr:hypothetical protein [Polyangia bacterium]